MKTERIDKVLAKHGFGTRKEVKKLLHTGLVLVNDNVVTSQDFKIDLEKDSLVVDNEKINLRTNLYIMMNKCQNVVCSSKDGLHKTVFDLLDEEDNHSFMGGDLHCTGRLDIDTEGLLILTTDGVLTHKLISPKSEITKKYAVTLREPVSPETQKQYIINCETGLQIPPEGKEAAFTSLPAKLEFFSETTCNLTITEGKYHQVKRMFQALGNEVIFLKRISIGNLDLDENLQPGEYRELSNEEINKIFSL
ncbi:MAG: rRNA pseudouridine synthase [Spirochaetaceae bacterium]|nr:rRNA pseudouridine synthase [Spirochaetaceae bacterium]